MQFFYDNCDFFLAIARKRKKIFHESGIIFFTEPFSAKFKIKNLQMKNKHSKSLF